MSRTVRFFAVHRDDLNGTHLHIAFTSSRRDINRCVSELRAHRAATAPNQRPISFYDFGPGDAIRPIADLTTEVL